MSTKAIYSIMCCLFAFINFTHAQTQNEVTNHEIKFLYSDQKISLKDGGIYLKRGKYHNYTFIIESSEDTIEAEIKPTYFRRKSTPPDLLKNFIYTTTPEQAVTGSVYALKNVSVRGDFTTLNITIKQKITETYRIDTLQAINGTTTIIKRVYDSYKPLSQDFQFYNYNYFRYGFSTGLFFNNLVNPTYYFADSSNTNKNIQKEKKSNVDIGIGALVHVQYVSKKFKVGPCFGVAVSLLDLKTKYMFGVSLTAGKRNEFTFSGGACGANLATLSSTINSPGYKVDVTKAPPTFDKWTWGGFFGISYSILNK